jgi:hypothetical protein
VGTNPVRNQRVGCRSTGELQLSSMEHDRANLMPLSHDGGGGGTNSQGLFLFEAGCLQCWAAWPDLRQRKQRDELG